MAVLLCERVVLVPALVAGAMLLPKEQVTARMLKELLTTQVLLHSKRIIIDLQFPLQVPESRVKLAGIVMY